MHHERNDSSSAIPASVGQAACGIVHDLANLIQTIILRAEVTAATEPVSEACIKRMEQIVDDGQLGANLIRSLLEHARKEVDSLEPSDIREAVRDAALGTAQVHGITVDLTISEEPLLSRADLSQLRDLVDIILSELMRDAAKGASYSLALAQAKQEGDALHWMSDEVWAMVRIERRGDGPMLDLEEGHLSLASGSMPPDDHALNLMRVRGIIRQHRGQVRSAEEVEDGRQSFIVEAFFPLV